MRGRIGTAEPFVRHLAAWRWAEPSVDKRQYSSPAWELVESAVRALNDDDLNDVIIGSTDHGPSYMGICGGNGRYWVSGELEDDHFFEAVDPEASGVEFVNITCGGQAGNPAANRIIGLADALEAASAFYWHGTLSGKLTWIHSQPPPPT